MGQGEREGRKEAPVSEVDAVCRGLNRIAEAIDRHADAVRELAKSNSDLAMATHEMADPGGDGDPDPPATDLAGKPIR